MVKVSSGDPLVDGFSALAVGRWADARAAFESRLGEEDSPHALFGLAMVLWWLGENQPSVDRCTHAYAQFRRSGDVEGAARCALWLAVTYKANFGNIAAANGWIARAERLLEPLPPGPLHGWGWVARAYRMADLDAAEDLTVRAVAVSRSAKDVDLELVALSQLGLIRVGQGDTEGGFGLIDEAMAAALAGEGSTLDTVVYTCCDMLNACELASDLERAAQWCSVADGFVDTYGCPFLYAECRIYYGSVLAAKGRWADAERELRAGLRITAGACPGLHARALARLAGLRVRQGRLEEAEQLLAGPGAGAGDDAEGGLWSAALLLARGDASGASRLLAHRTHDLREHQRRRASALELLVEAHLAAGDPEQAGAAARRLAEAAASTPAVRLQAMAAGALGRVALGRGDRAAAGEHLQTALRLWADLDLPYEVARTRFDLARVFETDDPEVAVGHARRALATLDGMGAGLDADRVAAFLRTLGVTPRTGSRGAGTLTVREQEVLRLLGAGLSNPEIAQRLHITRKTASHHVSSILAKLGLRNRAEAAAGAVGVLGAE